MDLSDDDVLQILKYLADSSFDELHLEIGDLKIHLNKTASPDSIEIQRTDTGETATVENASSLAAHDTDLDSAGEDPAALARLASPKPQEGQQSTGQEVVEEGLVPIKSPMLGTFYQAPKPGEPPFVAVGAIVNEATTVCLIEVMKLFTTIKAGMRGRITRIYAEDGQLVEYNQVLFVIDPDVDTDAHPAGA